MQSTASSARERKPSIACTATLVVRLEPAEAACNSIVIGTCLCSKECLAYLQACPNFCSCLRCFAHLLIQRPEAFMYFIYYTFQICYFCLEKSTHATTLQCQMCSINTCQSFRMLDQPCSDLVFTFRSFDTMLQTLHLLIELSLQTPQILVNPASFVYTDTLCMFGQTLTSV